MATLQQMLAGMTREELNNAIHCDRLQCESGLTIDSPEEDRIAWSETECGWRIKDNPCRDLETVLAEQQRRAGHITPNVDRGGLVDLPAPDPEKWWCKSLLTKGDCVLTYMAVALGVGGYVFYKAFGGKYLLYGIGGLYLYSKYKQREREKEWDRRGLI